MVRIRRYRRIAQVHPQPRFPIRRILKRLRKRIARQQIQTLSLLLTPAKKCIHRQRAVLPPFGWDEDRRLYLLAKPDAVFFHLYGVTDRDDIRYIYSTFPIIEGEETERHGSYRSRDLCLAWMNALAAGRPDAEIWL